MAGLDNLQQIAQVLKSNGTDGELVMGFREIAPEDISLNEPVFIVFDGLPVPFFIESLTKRGNTKALVRLTDICSMEDAEELAGKAVYVEDSQIPEMTLEEDGFAALIGWLLLTPEIPDQVGNDGKAVGNDGKAVGNDGKAVGDDGKAVGNDGKAVGDDGKTVGDDGKAVGDDGKTVGDDGKTVGDDGKAVGDDGKTSLPATTGNLYEVGEITDFIDIPNNPCIEVDTKNGAVMIPLHEDLILSVDPENLEIVMQIPAGLL